MQILRYARIKKKDRKMTWLTKKGFTNGTLIFKIMLSIPMKISSNTQHPQKTVPPTFLPVSFTVMKFKELALSQRNQFSLCAQNTYGSYKGTLSKQHKTNKKVINNFRQTIKSPFINHLLIKSASVSRGWMIASCPSVVSDPYIPQLRRWNEATQTHTHTPRHKTSNS